MQKEEKVHCFLSYSLINLIKKGSHYVAPDKKTKKGGSINLWAGFDDPGSSIWSIPLFQVLQVANIRNESKVLKYFLSNRQGYINYKVQLKEQAKYYD